MHRRRPGGDNFREVCFKLTGWSTYEFRTQHFPYRKPITRVPTLTHYIRLWLRDYLPFRSRDNRHKSCSKSSLGRFGCFCNRRSFCFWNVSREPRGEVFPHSPGLFSLPEIFKSFGQLLRCKTVLNPILKGSRFGTGHCRTLTLRKVRAPPGKVVFCQGWKLQRRVIRYRTFTCSLVDRVPDVNRPASVVDGGSPQIRLYPGRAKRDLRWIRSRVYRN